MKRRMIGVMAGVLLAGTVSAETADQPFEFGLSLARVKYTLDEGETGSDGSASTNGGKVFLGYRFNRFFAAEVAYLYGGSVETSLGAGILLDGKARALQPSVFGSFPLIRNMSVFGRLGAVYYDTTVNISDGITSVRLTDDGIEPSVGAGLMWSNDVVEFPTEFRIEYERVEFDLLDTGLISLGFAVRF